MKTQLYLGSFVLIAMSHTHHKPVKNSGEDTSRLRMAFFLNLFFSVIELIGGILTNSVAILSDALHDLGDSVSIGTSWIFQKVSTKKRNDQYSYGYKRFSVLGALINSLVLFGGSLLILYEAIPRLINPVMPQAKGMLLLAILGIVVNGIAVLKLGNGRSLNEKSVRLHLLEDVLGWIAVLIGSIVMLIWDVPIIDPVLSIFIALYILFNVFRNIREVLSIFLQAKPSDLNVQRLEEEIVMLEEIEEIHDLHAWSMDGSYNVLSVHLVINKNLSSEELIPVKQKLNKIVEGFGIDHATFEFETQMEKCLHENC